MKRTLLIANLGHGADTPATTTTSRSTTNNLNADTNLLNRSLQAKGHCGSGPSCSTTTPPTSGMLHQEIRPLKRSRINKAPEHIDQCTAAIKLTEDNVTTCSSNKKDNGNRVEVLKAQAQLLRDELKLSEAREVLEQILPLATGQSLMESLTELGSLCLDLGDLDSSMNYHNLALNMYLDQSNDNTAEQQHGPDQPSSSSPCAPCFAALAIVNLRHVAAIYLRFNRCQEALLCYTFIYKIQQDAAIAPLQEMASTLSCIGLMHYLMERFPEALRFYQEELRLRLQLHNGNMEQEDVAIALNSIGIVYFQLENLDQARQSFQSCLQIRQRLLGDGCTAGSNTTDNSNKMTSDPHCCCYDLAMVYFNLAAIAMKQSDDDQAARLYHRSMELKKAVFGPNHPEIAVDYQYLGQLFLDHGDSQTAIEYYTEAYKVVQTLGQCHAANAAATAAQNGSDNNNSNSNQQAKSAAQKLLVIIGNIHLLDANVEGMMSSFEQAARLETSESDGREFMDHVRVFGYHLYSISRMHPPCAPEA